MIVVPFVRVPLILTSALAFHVCMSPPTGALPLSSQDRDVYEEDDRRTRIHATARFITAVITKGFYWTSAVADTIVLLVPHVPTSLRPVLVSIPTSIPTSLPIGSLVSWTRQHVSELTLPRLTAIGAILVFTGALLRIAAYRTLDQFYACPPGPGPCPSPRRGPGPYTYRGARHAHALITSGPYAFLRHPGYAGLLSATVGFLLLHIDVGSHPSEVPRFIGVDVGQVCTALRTVALVSALLGTVGAIWRIGDEERALRERFKAEWELWAERVQYRLVPGVY